MNYRGEVTQAFGDGEYTFRLTVTGILELQDKCGAGFAAIYARNLQGAWDFRDIYETLRLGLIGGGMPAVDAKKLADRYVLPLAESSPVARLVLAGVMFGFEASPPGKEEAAPEQDAPTATDWTPPKSPEQPDLSASDRMSLHEFHSGNWWQ